ncbi:MAG: TCR/Tet family MFS transporter [Myxococcales bacterium]|nr:TCR/Tet family MFS transporter [Myxococcales bacterium]
MSKEPKKATLGFVFVTLFLDVLGMGIVLPIAPKLMASFGVAVEGSSRLYGAFVAVYALMLFAFSPGLGALSDRVGRRPVILFSLVGSAVDYLLMALAPTLWLLFLGRALSGLTGASAPAVGAYIADVTPPEKRAQSFGTMGMMFGIGFVVGPMIGGLLGDLGERTGIGMRLPFFVAAAVTAGNAVFGAFVLPESLSPENRKAFVWSSANPFAALPALRRYPAVFELVAALCVRQLGEYGYHATWVLYTTHKFGWTMRDNGISLAVAGLVIAFVQGFALRKLMPRWGEQKAVVVGYGLSFLAYVLFGVATSGWMLYAILVATGLSELAGPATAGLVSRHVPANEQGAVQGAITSVGSLTAVIAPAIATSVFAFFVSPRAPLQFPGAPFFVGSVFVAIAFALVQRSFRKHPIPPAGAAAVEGPAAAEVGPS